MGIEVFDLGVDNLQIVSYIFVKSSIKFLKIIVLEL